MIQSVCVMIQRSTAEPGTVRWHVKRSMWTVGKGSVERVLCEGSLTSVSTPEDPLKPVREVLEAAQEAVRALSPSPEPPALSGPGLGVRADE